MERSIWIKLIHTLMDRKPVDSHAPPKRRRLDQSTIPKAKVKAIQELSVGFVIDSDVPFTIFEHKFLKELFYRFDHDLALQILGAAVP